tara:strand:+ start:305 stop:694 length:390 start_codon:yes stop_codon:yes gene_type:complete
MAISKEEILEAISKMSVMDLVDLISAIEEKFGVSASAPLVAAAASEVQGDGSETSEDDDNKLMDLHLTEVGDKKVEVIKAVRSITGLGLKDAKGLVDEAPKAIKEGITKAEAEEFIKQLDEAGAKSELK